jgi:hypothetical protein
MFLVRLIGRRLFQSQKAKRRWLSRTLAVIAVIRMVTRRTGNPQRVVLRRNQRMQINIIETKES